MVEDEIEIDLSDAAIENANIAEILHRKINYMEERKRALGPEYYSAKDFWDRMWEAEWNALEERIKVEDIEGIETMPIEFPTIEVDDEDFTLYTFDDFALLHNQGIFRDDKFLIDRRGKWTKNIIREMNTYGYEHRKTIIISREKYLLMEAIQ